MGRFEGKTALVTGGASGIGLGTAKRLIEEGGFVFIADIDDATLAGAVELLGDRARGVHADVSKRADMAKVVDAIKTERGTLDLIFANAGASWYGTVDTLTDDDIDKGLDLDIKGTIISVQAVLPLLPDGASIIVNTSITQTMAIPSFGVYAAAKSGLRSLTRTWANELRDRRIRVNAVSPGTIETPAYEKDFGVEGANAFIAKVSQQIPAGRLGRPEDIGNAVVFLASDEASFINGTELTVDGGQIQVYAGVMF